MGARKRYPLRARVSTKRGFSAESPSASRSRLTAAFSPWSKSTKVSAGHSRLRSSSRVTISPGFSSSMVRIWNGCSCRRTLEPLRLSSPPRRSASNEPKLTISLLLSATRSPSRLCLLVSTSRIRRCFLNSARYPSFYPFDVRTLSLSPANLPRVTRRALRYAAFTSILAQLEACRDACADDPEVNLVWHFSLIYLCQCQRLCAGWSAGLPSDRIGS